MYIGGTFSFMLVKVFGWHFFQAIFALNQAFLNFEFSGRLLALPFMGFVMDGLDKLPAIRALDFRVFTSLLGIIIIITIVELHIFYGLIEVVVVGIHIVHDWYNN